MNSQNSRIAQHDGLCFSFPKKKAELPRKIVKPVNGVCTIERAAALVISNDFKGHDGVRNGAQEDVDRVVDLLKVDLNVQDPQLALNMTTKQLRHKLNKFASSEAAHQAECLLVFVMSHGDDGVVYTTPDACNTHPSVRYQDIWEPITDQHVGKPLLFFIQACKGDKCDLGIEVAVQTNGAHADDCAEASETAAVDASLAFLSRGKEASVAVDLPNLPNVLLAFATVSGFYSYRKTQPRNDASEIGSYFFRAFCTEMKDRVDTDDIMKVLTRVNRRVALTADIKVRLEGQVYEVKQCCSVVSFLNHKVVFPRVNRTPGDSKCEAPNVVARS